MNIWVDTDMGFDDIWALLLLEHLQVTVAGLSMVAGNAPLPQVIKNAQAAITAFGFNWPAYIGAARPLQREPETAERILGEFGMQSRGLYLPYNEPVAYLKTNNSMTGHDSEVTAIDALVNWLSNTGSHQILAMGPLTSIALLLQQHPASAQNIDQIVWLGGSRGRGNHSRFAEYNALADPEALSAVAKSGIPFRMIDLELCRQVTFSEADIPLMHGRNKQLLTDLVGGYLDIALQRGRTAMSVYDPLAALAITDSKWFEFSPATLAVHIEPDAEYGRTNVSKVATDQTSHFEIATEIDAHAAREICLAALTTA